MSDRSPEAQASSERADRPEAFSRADPPAAGAQSASTVRRGELQRLAAFQLLLGGLFLIGLTIAAVWLVLQPQGLVRESAVVPLLDAYMQAGRDHQSFAAHALYSERGLEESSYEGVVSQIGQREAFEGYREIEIIGFTARPVFEDEGPSHEAEVTARIRYDGGGPEGELVARLDLDGNVWRIRHIEVSRANFP